MEWFSITDRGKIRKRNEDSISFRIKEKEYLGIVADGLGGENAGDYASSMAVEKTEKFFLEKKFFDEKKLKDFIKNLSIKVHEKGLENENLREMGTTITAFFIKNKTLLWVHVGDSRLWVFKNNRLKQITKDHRFIQDLIDDNTISEDEAKVHPMRHVLDQCVGIEEIYPDSGSLKLNHGDIILLSSDGLHDYVEKNIIEKILGENKPIKEACNNLLDKALDAGGKDNISILAVKI